MSSPEISHSILEAPTPRPSLHSIRHAGSHCRCSVSHQYAPRPQNDLKYNKFGGKIIIVTYIDENKNYVFEIKDSGDGIRKKDYDKIFNFFSQVNRNKLKRQQGSGVGLALCKVIANAHHGDIGFKSRLNNGSTFWFSIPQYGCEDVTYIEF